MLVYGLLYFVLRWFFLEDLKSFFPGIEWNHFLGLVFLLFSGGGVLLFTGMMAFVYFELLIPMGILFSRLKRIHIQEDASEEELESDETGEWTELESALANLRSELQKSKKGMNQNVALLATLVDALPEGVLAVDRRLRPVFFNETFLDILHLTRDDLQTRNLFELIRDPQVNSCFESCLRGQGKSRVVFVSPKGGLIYQVTVAPIRDSDGEGIRGVVSVFQDVTDLKKLESMRIDFVANVSHELRTPLTSVKGYAQTLMEDIRERRFEQGERYLEVIGRNVDRLLELVGDLLDLSSLESGVGLRLTEVKTETLTQSILEQVEPDRRRKNLEIVVKGTEARLVADAARVQQVLLNLVQNAIKYVPEGRRIEIEWRDVGSGLELLVRDNGPGIAEEHLPRLFERFYRVDKARNREAGGTGLGLAIVKHIMQRHGGSVRVQSTLGMGTEFICHFPWRTVELPIVET